MVRLIPLDETFKCMCLCPAHTGALRSYAKARTWRLGHHATRGRIFFSTYNNCSTSLDTCHIMSGPKASHLCITQYNSTILTPRMMDDIHHSADEIVSTRGIGIQYTLVHLKKKASSGSLANALKTLESIGVKGSEIFGYNTVEGNTPSASEHLENHPGFRTLVDHEKHKNSEFRRWTADGYNPNGLSGYNLLKTRLLANQASEGSTSEQASDGGFRGNDGSGVNNNDETEEETTPHSRPAGSNEERNKRQRTEFPGGGVPNMVSLDAIMGNVSSVLSAAVASAINSSGSAIANARDEERNLMHKEQQRREIAEIKLKELEMHQKFLEQRRLIEVEVSTKHEKALSELRHEHDAQLKANDDAHAVAMGGLRGELYSKYEEERLKALEEASAARGKVEEEKSKLETDLQELGLSKVI